MEASELVTFLLLDKNKKKKQEFKKLLCAVDDNFVFVL